MIVDFKWGEPVIIIAFYYIFKTRFTVFNYIYLKNNIDKILLRAIENAKKKEKEDYKKETNKAANYFG